MIGEVIIQFVGLICFVAGILHMLATGWIRRAIKGPAGRWLGEVEIVFAAWALVYLVAHAISKGWASALTYVTEQDFESVLLIFALMIVCSARPVVAVASRALRGVALGIPIAPAAGILISALSLGPLFGSLVTEPAAMTITALTLRTTFFKLRLTERLRYQAFATLLVNISVGGLLTRYAAAPVLVVAEPWGWTSAFVASHFGVSAVLTCISNVSLLLLLNWREIRELPPVRAGERSARFTDLHAATGTALFLGGLLILGPAQRWWLEPFLKTLSAEATYVCTAGLTAVIDNAAITYLAAQVPNLPELTRLAVVAGAVAGGGLTLMANAPNPAANALLKGTFPNHEVRHMRLLTAALRPTFVALFAFALVG